MLGYRRRRLVSYLAIAGVASLSVGCGVIGSILGGSGSINSHQDADQATIRIESEGNFVPPGDSQELTSLGSGSGFIIDPTGIAVTNNHVVTGGTIFRVWVGEERESRSASVLGASECSDLAVIQIGGGSEFAHFEWFDGEITPGMDAWAAGFPLGQPQFTLTSGSVTRGAARLNSQTSSVEAALEHDARINPGNSGGPLITSKGKVVGVNYSADVQGITPQYKAIARDEALSIIEELRSGNDVESIGVNARAVRTESGEEIGVWVSSVKPGSIADQAGIRGGDVITKLGGLDVVEGGTMARYCEILRSSEPWDGNVLPIEVIRWSTRQVAQGQLNGDRVEFGSQTASASTQSSPASSRSPRAGYTLVNDDTNSLRIDIHNQMRDLDTSGKTFADVPGAYVHAATDMDAYRRSWGTPGVKVFASSGLVQRVTPAQLLEEWTRQARSASACQYDSQYDERSPNYSWTMDVFLCGSTVAAFSVALSPDRSHMVLVEGQLSNRTHLEAYKYILEDMQVFADRLPR